MENPEIVEKLIEKEEKIFKYLIEKKQIKQVHKKYSLTLLYSLLDDNIISYEIALGIKPQTAVDYYNHGVYYANKNNFSHAIKLFQKAIELDERLSAAHYNLALAYKATKDTHNFKKELQEFITLEKEKLKDTKPKKLSEGEINWLDGAKRLLEAVS